MTGRVEGGYYKVRGPGFVEPVDGSVEALGSPVSGRLVVPAGRTLLVRVEGSAVVSGQRVEEMGADEYESIDSLARELAGKGRVVLVGPSDVGKSTLAAWIANRWGGGSLLTVDVGQNEVFAPGFASLAEARPPVVPGLSSSFAGVKPCFVGAFSPSGALASYLRCASRLSRETGDRLVVDTDGWVEAWDGLESKAAIALATGARVVAAVGLPEWKARYLEDYAGIEVVRVPRLAGGQGKSGEERRLHRERLLAQRLVGARERPVRPGEAEIIGLPVFRGEPVPIEAVRAVVPGAVYAEKGDDGLVVVTTRRVRPQGVKARVVQASSLEGLIAAAHWRGSVEVAVVTRVNFRSVTVNVATRLEGVERLEVGRARVDPQALLGQAKW